MEMTSPTTMNDLESMDTNVFAYKLLQDPAPGKVVYHSAVTQYIMYGLGSHVLDYMIAGTTADDVAKHIMATYSHPSRTFEIHAPGLVHVKAPQNLNFTYNHPKFGPLSYRLGYIADYTQAQKYDSTTNAFSCIVTPQGKDIALTNDEEIERCVTAQAELVGFSVTRFNRGLSTITKSPLNLFYVDMSPHHIYDIDAYKFKLFKETRGPSGSIIKFQFKKGFEEIFTSVCPKCLHHKTKHCICAGNPGKRPIDSDDARAAKRARALSAMEAAFGS